MYQRTRTLTRVALFAALMSVASYIKLPLGPVPLTMQTFVALVAGYVLGPGQASVSMILYTAVGLAGLPVFSSGGGPAYILSPTFGYIIGFTACAAVTGSLAPLNRNKSVIIAYCIMLAGLAAVYIPGVTWLVLSLNWIADVPAPVANLLKAGLVIPLAGDLVTTIPAAVLSVRLKEILP